MTQTTNNTDATAGINAALANPKADTQELDALEEHLFALGYAIGELGSLGEIIDPPLASQDRGMALSILQEDAMKLLCTPEVGDLLDRLDANKDVLDESHKAQVKVLKRDRAQLMDIPPEEMSEFVRLTVETYDVWLKAKRSDDWSIFEPHLEKIVETQKRFASYKDASKDPYDVWLNEYEYGSNCTFYDIFFGEVKDCVVPLLADVVKSPFQLSDDCVAGNYNTERQLALARELVELEGINMDAFWLGETEHPFMGGPNKNFVIVGTHVHEDNLLSGIYSILHEGGHALYEQNVDDKLRRTSLAGGTSSGMHEAQSRFFENIIGRSRPFMEPLLALLRKYYPGRLNLVTANQLYQAANIATPSLIRTEADELTYPLHVIVRYEIERALFTGEAKVSDVPKLWSEKYKSYLGVDVPNNTQGALQDMHWSDGSFGYFPTYALGNAYGAQIRAKMLEEGIDFENRVAQGDLSQIRDWLRTHIWRYGRSKDAGELIHDACGEDFSARYYCDYLQEKFQSLYQLA